MTLRRFFVDPPEPKTRLFLYGFLALSCALLAWNVYIFFRYSPNYRGDPYGGLILAVMLLLNHVTLNFRLPSGITIIARIFALAWLVFTLVYVSYLSRIFFPLH